MADFLSRSKKINTIELMNSDPLLSQFKHHFILLKVYLPRKMNLQNFAQKIPEGFGLSYNLENSVYIAQLVNVYDEDLVDVAIGFRRDETAIKIARRSDIQFKQDNRASKVQLSNGFQIFMQELRNEELQQQKVKDDYTNMRTKKSETQPSKPEQVKKTISQQILDRQADKLGKDIKKQKRKGQDNSSPSRSRSREKRKKQIFNRISQPQLHKQKSITQRITSKK